MDIKQIKRLISLVEESQISAFSIEEDNVKIEIKKESAPVHVTAPLAPAPIAAPAQAPAAAPAPAAPTAEEPAKEDAGLVAIKSPMVGTFYSASSPEAKPFIGIGDSVKSGDVVCIVEAMKLFNEIESDISGKIEKILVENAQPVEFGQELFLVRV